MNALEHTTENTTKNRDKGRRYASIILAGLLRAVSLLVTGIYYVMQKKNASALYLCVQVNASEILRTPLSENALYMIKDGVAEQVSEDTSLLSLGEEGLASLHDVNFVRIKDGVVTCTESNCDNQVCVFTPAISGDSYDLPIVCLPHQLILQIKN